MYASICMEHSRRFKIPPPAYTASPFSSTFHVYVFVVCVRGFYVCSHACVDTCVCFYMWKPKADVRPPPQLFSTLFTEPWSHS